MAKYIINYLDRKSHINKNIYGHFSEHLGRCIYDGVWVGENSPIPNVNGVRKDVIDALKQIKVPILRWPGGCFADTYHWKDGVGPQASRKTVANRMWGGVVEDNSFGTHEFMDMCEEIGCGAYLSGNLGSGTIQEMVEWVEYICDDIDTPMARWRRENGREKPWKIEAFGVGNEVWGCGGQMSPEYYATQFRQASHFINYVNANGISDMLSGKMKEQIKMIASGPNAEDYDFTDVLTKDLTRGGYNFNAMTGKPMADGVSLHYYTFPGKKAFFDAGTATEFEAKDWYHVLKTAAKIEDIVIRHDHVMSKYDPEKKIGLMVDEWGAWYKVEPGTNPAFLFQQNTMRDAVLAALTLNIFNKHSDRVKLATIAQMINVLQSVILTEGEKMVLTPTYHVFDMYKGHQEATLLGSFIESQKVGIGEDVLPNLFESSSVDADGNVLSTICNTSIDSSQTLEATLFGAKAKAVHATILWADPHACNTFADPDTVTIKTWTAELTDEGFRCEIPAGAVVSVQVQVG